jgi:pyrroline-5-carboxylate reductase
MKNLLFIGGGNMAKAIIAGLIKQHYSSHLITVVDRNEEKRSALTNAYNIHCVANVKDEELLLKSEVIFLCVKPQGAQETCLELVPFLKGQRKTIVSVMAGIELSTLQKWLGSQVSIVRTMPNTPSAIQEGATGLCCLPAVSTEEKIIVENLLTSIGKLAWVDEEKMSTVTALSGSGPAYYFYFTQLLSTIALELGLPQNIAEDFALQTFYGAAVLAKEAHEKGKTLETLRKEVTSKKGTTEAAINTFEKLGLKEIFKQALEANIQRSKEIAVELG